METHNHGISLTHAITLVFVMFLSFGLIAQERVRIELLDPDPGTGSCYGRSVAIHGDHVFVGEPDPGGDGRVHVFERNAGGLNNWGWVQTIEPPVIQNAQMLHTGHHFGFVAVAADGMLFVLRLQTFFYLEEVNANVCAWHALYTYALGEDGLWEHASMHGGEPRDLCGFATGCDSGIGPLMVTSGSHFARGQHDVHVVPGSMNQPPIQFLGIALSDRPVTSIEDTMIYTNQVQTYFHVLALAGDTLLVGGAEGFTMFRMGEGELGAFAMEEAPDLDYAYGVNPMNVVGRLLAVGYRNDGAIASDAGSVLLYDLAEDPPAYVGKVVGDAPVEGRRAGHDVELQEGYLAMLSAPIAGGGQPTVELFVPCAGEPGWCSVGIHDVPDDAPLHGDAFRMNTNGEFVVATDGAVHLFFDPELALAVPTMAPMEPIPEIRSIDGERLVLRLPEAYRQARLIVRDMLGRPHHESRAAGGTAELPIAHLASGIHLVQVSEKHRTVTLKFFKP